MNELHLNKTKCFEDFANHVALLLWEGLLQEQDLPRPDPHRFPGMSQALHRVFQHRVGICPACSGEADGEQPPIIYMPSLSNRCRDHTERLMVERGRELDVLVSDVEKKTVDFLARQDPKRAAYKALPDKVHHAVDKIKPYLIENIACSRCSNRPNTLSSI